MDEARAGTTLPIPDHKLNTKMGKAGKVSMRSLIFCHGADCRIICWQHTGIEIFVCVHFYRKNKKFKIWLEFIFVCNMIDLFC